MLKFITKTLIISCIFSIVINPCLKSYAKSFDINKDGVINYLDLSALSKYLQSDENEYDLNNDGIVDTLDLALLAKQISNGNDKDLIFSSYDKNGNILNRFPKDNLIEAISNASQNNGVVKLENSVIWNRNGYYVYSNNELNTNTQTIKEATKIAYYLKNSIIPSKNGNIIYNKNQNYRKILGVTIEDLNLKEYPNLKSNTITIIPYGTLVEVSSIFHGFYNIDYYDFNHNLHTGYVAGYLDIIQDDINCSQLGYISAREESNGDPGAIGLNPNDKGGASFGVWQLSSKMGSVDEFLNFIQDISPEIYNQLMEAKYKDNNNFEDNFINKWKEIADNNYDEFYELQRLFIKETYYDSFIKIAKKNNLNIEPLLELNSTSNMIWSTSVQHGPGGAIKIIKNIDLNSTIENIINRLYEERLILISKSYPPNSLNPGVVSIYNGIKKRLENERYEILRIYEREITY